MRRYLTLILLFPFFLLMACTRLALPSPSAAETETPSAAQTAAASPESTPELEASEETTETKVIVFAAASMQETLTEIQTMYRKAAPDVVTVCNFDSSGTLKTQIEEGAPCDVFISAAQKQMNQLGDGEEGKEGLHMIDPATRIDLLENKVTLVVPAGNPAGITGFEDLAEKLKSGDILLAIGNSDVPVGQYTQKIFAHFGLDEAELAAGGVLTYGSNVKEVTTQVSQGSVAAGIIYATDAFSAGLEIVAEATPEMCGQVIYPAAVLNESRDKPAAVAFLQYLTTPEAMAVFESVGFSPAE